MCSAERPENYEIPDIYQPDEEEILRLQHEELASLQYEQVRHYSAVRIKEMPFCLTKLESMII